MLPLSALHHPLSPKPVESAHESVYELDIGGTSYYVTSEEDGPIYSKDDAEGVGDQVGQFKGGLATFNAVPQESPTVGIKKSMLSRMFGRS